MRPVPFGAARSSRPRRDLLSLGVRIPDPHKAQSIGCECWSRGAAILRFQNRRNLRRLQRAAAYGRPVVASNLTDLRAASDEEQLALDYVPAADPAALAQALGALLADPARQAHMANRNLEVMRRMTLEHTCARYLDLFQQARA